MEISSPLFDTRTDPEYNLIYLSRLHASIIMNASRCTRQFMQSCYPILTLSVALLLYHPHPKKNNNQIGFMSHDLHRLRKLLNSSIVNEIEEQACTINSGSLKQHMFWIERQYAMILLHPHAGNDILTFSTIQLQNLKKEIKENRKFASNIFIRRSTY